MAMELDIIERLRKLGFSNRQSHVYTVLLRVGRITGPKLAKMCQLARSSCYETLEQMAIHGLVTLEVVDKVRWYYPTTPEHLRLIFEIQSAELAVRLKEVDALLPMLSGISTGASGIPKIRLVTNREEVDAIHEEYCQLKDEILQFVSYDEFLKWQTPTKMRKRNRGLIKTKSVGRAIILTNQPFDLPVGTFFECRSLSTNYFNSKGEFTVCGDRVLMFTYGERRLAVEIISEVLADTCRVVLELAWRQAGELIDQERGKKS